jgi:PHD/YefM family antitoxin component YafN of YafNO toxin-antitoxin module
MAEHIKSITEIRQNLPNFSQDAEQKMDRYVITNQGRPQSVLVGYLDYQKMRAATELVMKPDAMASIRRGLAQYRDGIRLTADQVREKLQDQVESNFPAVKTKLPKTPTNLKTHGLMAAKKRQVKNAKSSAEEALGKTR